MAYWNIMGKLFLYSININHLTPPVHLEIWIPKLIEHTQFPSMHIGEENEMVNGIFPIFSY